MKSTYTLTLLLAAGILLIASSSLRAADANLAGDSSGTMTTTESMGNESGLYYSQTNSSYYRAEELSVDGFGTASLGQYTIENPSKARVRNNTEFGAGVGLNYYITRNFGIGADGYSENTTGAFIDSASANLLLRLPLGESGFAPYAYGGGGYQFDMVETWFGQGGVGIEYRFTPHVGTFLDARLAIPNETKYYGVIRLGLRFAF